ncbi:MAG: enoyl-CoA hydratase/isomerase family protein [Hyphomicrobiaceae bacterium]
MADVLFDVPEKGIAVITINRPENRNAINSGVRQGLFDAWRRLEDDKALRAGILTGSGDKAFCAGADLKEMADMKLGVLPRGFLPVLGDNVHVSKPVIAAVNGVAFAGGWLLAQMCDLCIASTTARFGVTEAKVGRGMAWAVPLIHMIPQRVMMEVLVTAQPVTPQRAYEIGFVNHVVEPDQLMPRALEMARQIVENAPLTVAAAKEVVQLATEMGCTAALRAATHAFDHVYRSADAQEGPAAFREKRKPQWRGE